MIKKRFISMLVLLAAVVTGARAQWTGETYTATATENLGAITVNGDATLTINEGVTVTVTGGINVASGTLTVTGPGTLVVTGAKGTDGGGGFTGGNGTPGGVAISGNIIVQDGATVQANGGAGGNGGAGEPENGGHGANGGAAISGNVTVQGGATVTATGGNGGNGGNSGGETGGNGGNGGNAFAGTLTYKSGTVTANGGSGGSGGTGMGGMANGSSGSAGKAFANDVDFTQTTGYSVTNGTSPIGSVLNQTKVVISGGTPAASTYTVTLKEGTEDATSWTIAPDEATTTGVAAGTEVKATYGGTKKVKSVKAKKKAAADNPAPTTASIEDYTAGTFGWDGDGSAATNLPTINTFAANDEISILSAKNTNTQFTTSAGGASATFSGTATDDSKFYAVYPYTDGLALSGDVISGVVIPTNQWNSGWNSKVDFSGWDPKAPIAYATTTGSSLTFHNACAILKVTFPETAMYGRFTISANEPLAGTFSLDTSTGTLTPTSGITTVTVGDPSNIYSGICTDFSGKTVYVAIAPGTYTGFNLHIYNEDDDEKSITKSTSVTFEAGKIYDLGSYDLFDFRRL